MSTQSNLGRFGIATPGLPCQIGDASRPHTELFARLVFLQGMRPFEGNMTNFTYGSLFSGIGGIDLGLDRAGFSCQWQVEIDAYCQHVLAKHWPHVTRYGDIRAVGKHNLPPVDLVCGGFPCQDISVSNQRNPQGINGERSGLWSEYYRLICELRPAYILVENVAALLYRGLGRVLGDLAHVGYDAEWQVLRACDFGLPHERKRLFIIAYSHQVRRLCLNTHNLQRRVGGDSRTPSNTLVLLRGLVAQLEESWRTPAVLRVDDGLPYWLDRLGSVGNAVVPQIAEYIGRCILASLAESR